MPWESLTKWQRKFLLALDKKSEACFDRELLVFFGAEETTLALAREYVFPIKFVIPCFLFTQMLAAYLRNDKNPTLATAAVLAGGIFNIFGDYFFVFVCDMGAMGAGLATAVAPFCRSL